MWVNVRSSIDEVKWEDYPSFDAPYSFRPLVKIETERNDMLHYMAACRCIVAAANGGQLRVLALDGDEIQEPFAIRSLVPIWVQCEVLGYDKYESDEPKEVGEFEVGRWACAAAWIRRALSHASLWLPDSKALPRESRHLTTSQVQSMLSYFRRSNSTMEREQSWPSLTYAGSRKMQAWHSKSRTHGTKSWSEAKQMRWDASARCAFQRTRALMAGAQRQMRSTLSSVNTSQEIEREGGRRISSMSHLFDNNHIRYCES